MAQLWGGRFTKATEQKVYDFNASITFDKRLFQQDIEGSIAHSTMLAKQGILTIDERDAIVDGLKSILVDVEEGKLLSGVVVRHLVMPLGVNDSKAVLTWLKTHMPESTKSGSWCSADVPTMWTRRWDMVFTN